MPNKISRLWRKYVYNSRKLPIEWGTHPHCVIRPVSRYSCACLGSIIPVGLILIRSGVLKQLDHGDFDFNWSAWGPLAVATVGWFIGIIVAASSEQRSLLKYIFAGTVPSPVLYVVLLSTHVYA